MDWHKQLQNVDELAHSKPCLLPPSLQPIYEHKTKPKLNQSTINNQTHYIVYNAKLTWREDESERAEASLGLKRHWSQAWLHVLLTQAAEANDFAGSLDNIFRIRSPFSRHIAGSILIKTRQEWKVKIKIFLL